MDRERKIYTEVYMALASFDKNLINKIPEELKNMIISNADTSFPYEINELLPESKALIAAIIDKYFGN